MNTSSPSRCATRAQLTKNLRDAAVKEVNHQTKGRPTFDAERGKLTFDTSAADEFDRTNGVASYPGPNVEHIGNGTGGVR